MTDVDLFPTFDSFQSEFYPCRQACVGDADLNVVECDLFRKAEKQTVVV